MHYVTQGEIFYLRLLLLKRFLRSYEEALTVNNRIFKTFQQAAVANGYIHSIDECIQIFDEFLLSSTPAEIRRYFCLLLVNGFPMFSIYDNQYYKDLMIEDYSIKCRPVIETIVDNKKY